MKKNKNVLYTKKKTLITDNFQNSFQLSGLFFDIENKIFKAKKIELSDKENNSLFVENGFVNIKTNELVGSDFNLELNKNIFGNSENDPRLIGRYIITDKSNTIMKKSKFTYLNHLNEEIQIRLDNNQNILMVIFIFIVHCIF